MIRPGRPYNSLKEYNKDTYYLREGAHIEFIGKGSDTLGLIGQEMTAELYQNLISANDANGLPLTKNAGTEDHRTGYDLPFSPHKSVSLAYFYGNEQQKSNILTSHNQAVRKVADYIERNLIQYRMSGGKVFQRTDNMVAAHFNHFVSRDLDPQLHSHLVIFNMVLNDEGKWYSLSGDMIHESRLITEMYHTELAINLKEKGYGVDWVKCGKMTAARISGVSDQAIEIHSKRSKAIHKREKTMIREFPNATLEEIRNMAVLDTRAPKKKVNMEAVEASCRAELSGHGIDPDSMASLKKEVRIMTGEEKEAAARKFIDLAISHIAEREMVFTKNEVLKYALDFSRDLCGTDCLEKAFLENESLHKIGILTDKVGGRRTKEIRYTTKELASDEKFAVQLTWEHNKQDMMIIPKKEVVRYIKDYEKEEGRKLTAGQKQAVIEILAGRRMSAIQGDPGVGKTTLIRTARRILEISGSKFSIIGLAPTGQAAKELRNAAGVESGTVDSFLLNPRDDMHDKIVVVDEISMLGIRKVAALQRIMMKYRVKGCMVGDIKQMQAVDAGNYFGTIQKGNRLHIIKMEDRVRQKTEKYRSLIDRVINAEVETVFHFMKKENMLQEISDPRRRMMAAAEEFIKKPDNSLVVVARNSEAREMNDIVRERIRCRLGEDHEVKTLIKDNITRSQASLWHTYDDSKRLVVFGEIDGIFKKGAVLSVCGHDSTHNRILVRDQKSGQESWIDPVLHVEKFQVYKETVQSFAKGDTIMFLNNDRKLGVQNGTFGKIKQFDGRNFNVDIGHGHDRVFNISEYPYLTHGYAVTTEKSQGASIPANITVWSFKNKGMNKRNSLVVGLTRGIDQCKSFVDNSEKLAWQFEEWKKKSSAMETQRKYEIERSVG